MLIEILRILWKSIAYDTSSGLNIFNALARVHSVKHELIEMNNGKEAEKCCYAVVSASQECIG